MDLSYSDEQQFLREAVRGTVEREAPFSQVRDWVLGDTVDHHAAAALASRQGWTGIGVPEDRGGQGGGALELSVLAEELGRGAVPADLLYASILAAITLARSDDRRALEQVDAISSGAITAALLRSAATPLDVPAADGTTALVLGAHPGAALITLHDDVIRLADPDATDVRPRRLVDRTRTVADVTPIPEAGRELGALEPSAYAVAAAHAAVIVAADLLGASQRMLDLTVEYVGQRVQFGVAVGSFQAVKHAASEMLVAIEGTRAVLQYAAWAIDADEPGAPVDAWVAKARAARAASLVADKALFLHGAVGYTWEHDLQLLFKRAKSGAVLFGGPGLYEDRIADALELVGSS
jgi:alkylation response protein AidB-like acyl-CoA dehydrogenase